MAHRSVTCGHENETDHEDADDAQHPVGAELLVDLRDEQRPHHARQTPRRREHAQPRALQQGHVSHYTCHVARVSPTGLLLPPTTFENIEAERVRQKG